MSNLENIFNDSLKLDSANVYLKSFERQLTFQELRQFAKNISQQLKNIPQESLVLLDIRDPFYFMGYVLACLHLKLKPALLNSYFKKNQIDDVLKTNSYNLFITDQKHTDHKTLFIDSTKPFEFQDGDFKLDLKSELIFFTSGSIQSKACVLKLENFFYSAQGSSENIPFTATDTWGMCLPLFHVGGFSIMTRAILAQATVAVLDNNKNYQEQLDYFKVTHASFVSTQFVRYLDQYSHLINLKYILLGGSAIPEIVLKKAIELGLPIYKSYGMTEMASQICTTKKLTKNEDIVSSGHVLNYREFKIHDKKIYVKGPCLFQGYLKHNKLTQPFDNEGWFSTGDNGEIHNKEVQILGRTDRIFQSAGENISPETIEQELLKVPGILRAYVCPETDTQYGYRAIAYIDKAPTLDDAVIFKLLEKNLSGLYRPKALRSWNELPKTSWKM